jgi:hypothetical protein
MNNKHTIEMIEAEWRDRLVAAVKEEREACARIAASHKANFLHDDHCDCDEYCSTANTILRAIRLRSKLYE